jgi:sn-glycerol 3-phosphate transport system ATP-binding protein
LSNLDAKLRGQMRVEIRRLQQSLGTTAIYVTHDQVEAMTLADRLIVMNAGVAEQVGTPLELYERPATLFVAGFIGSPAMNFVAAVPAAEDGWLEIDDDTRLRPPPDRAPLPPGRKLTLGIRPEHLTLAGGIAPLTVAVELVEMLGADTIVHGRLRSGARLLARLPGSARVKLGERVPLGIDPARLHVFDEETGKRL